MNKEKLWQRSKQKIRFKNDDMDFYFAWILSHQCEGGSAFGECFYAASQIKDGDLESWYAAWAALASRVESQATQALEKGHRVSAREAYLRAFTYYRSAVISSVRETHACGMPGKRRKGASGKRRLRSARPSNPSRFRSRANPCRVTSCEALKEMRKRRPSS